MDMIEVSQAEKEEIWKLYQVNESTIKQDIEVIKTWKSKQPHLPKVTDDFIEKVLLRNKFRVERTKQKLDNYYSLRGNNRDFIKKFENVVPSKHVTSYLPLPKLGPNFERIIIIRLNTFDPEQYDVFDIITLNLAIEELTTQYDYSLGARYMVDFEGWTLKHLPKLNPVPFAKHIGLIEQAYSSRTLGIELLNCPSFVSKMLGLLKLVLRPKIYNRVRIHKDLDSLHQVIPKQCLPKEYGGSMNNTIPELLEKWDEVMKEHKEFFLESYNNVSQEDLRLAETKFNETFGFEGTFKKLQLD